MSEKWVTVQGRDAFRAAPETNPTLTVSDLEKRLKKTKYPLLVVPAVISCTTQ